MKRKQDIKAIFIMHVRCKSPVTIKRKKTQAQEIYQTATKYANK